jgi:hypothetical protein
MSEASAAGDEKPPLLGGGESIFPPLPQDGTGKVGDQVITFWFLRHGTTNWNVKGLWQGEKDIALNATGLDEAATAAARLATISQIKAIYTSDLQRARYFSYYILACCLCHESI